MLFVDIEDFWRRNSTIIDDCYHTFYPFTLSYTASISSFAIAS